MEKLKKYFLPTLNIVATPILVLILFLSSLSESVVYIMMMTVIVGWAIPYLVPLLTGLALISKDHYKSVLFLNIISIVLDIFIIVMLIILYDKKLLVMLIEYIIIILLCLINIIYLTKYVKKSILEKRERIKKEKTKIKKIKDENNGAIL